MSLYKPFAEELLTVTATATPLTAATYKDTDSGAASGAEYASPPIASIAKANSAVLEVLSESIYYTLNGGTPTSADHLAATNDTITLTNYQQIQNFRAVRIAASNATIAVTYYRE